MPEGRQIMAETQSVKCISCGKVIGTLDCNSGDFHTIHFTSIKSEAALDRDSKSKSKAAVKTREDFTKGLEVKNGYRKQKNPHCNLADGESVICSCGQTNKII